ncbi:MAG: hypothetical protein R2717_09265 [Schumannella sp.]|nr:hypothetical protein [Microbacteriaceae bacterium]
MTTLHKVTVPVLGLLAAATLAGCSLLTPSTPTTPTEPTDPPAPTVTVEDLNDTSWAGTDSEGTETTFTLHSGGSTAVSFSGNAYDDPGDTWALSGTTLTITIYNVEGVGDAVYTGNVADAAGPIDLALSFTDVTDTRTLTITKQ